MSTRVITFKLPKDVVEDLDLIARLQGMSRSEVLRQAVRKLLDEYMNVSSTTRPSRPRRRRKR